MPKSKIIILTIVSFLLIPSIIFSFNLNISFEQSILNSIKSQINYINDMLADISQHILSLLAQTQTKTGTGELDINTGLIRNWTFDEGSGNIAHDSSGNGNDGKLMGGPLWSEELTGPALNFDGKDDYVDLGDIDAFEFGPDDRFTISLWVKIKENVINPGMNIIGRNNGSFWTPSVWTWYLHLVSQKGWFGFGIGDGTSYNFQRSFYSPGSDKWYHIAVVVGKQGEAIDFYVNGKLQEGKSITRTIGQLRQTSDSFKIGGDPYGKAAIDDIRIYNRALNQDEITAVMSAIGQRAPEAKDQEITITTNTSKNIVLKAQDVNLDPLTYQIVTPPSNGILKGTGKDITYTPNTDFTGADSFTFKANNGTFDSNIATVSITVGLPAFPGAEGFGAIATGGRGGKVIHVTTLEDNGYNRNYIPGSLRWALAQKGPRIIVFDVGGVIEIPAGGGWGAMLRAADGDFTIAGQTAPEGITISGNQIWLDKANNFIIRNLRLRGAHNYPESKDTQRVLSINHGNNFIIDHVSLTGSGDESPGVYGSSDYTFQWVSVEESALWGQGGIRHEKGNHNFGGLFSYSPYQKLTLHHTLFANHLRRMPRIGRIVDGGADLRNNVYYNWQTIANQLMTGNFNVVGNVYLVGPSTLAWRNGAGVKNLVVSNGANFYPPQFLDDPSTETDESNLWYKNLNPNSSPDSNMPVTGHYQANYNFINEPFPAPPVTTEKAIDAYNSVLNKVGAWPRDATTRRTVNEVRTRTGGMGLRGPYEWFPKRVGPTADPAVYPNAPMGGDADRDGIPRDWELAHNLDPNNPDDANDIVPVSVSQRHAGYTYIEYYINELADNIVGVSGQTYTIQTSVSPEDSGAIIPSHGNYDWETEHFGGYNAPYDFGKIDFGTAEYNDGSIVIMKAKPKPGYIFDHWEGGSVDGLTSTQISFPATSNVNVIAYFRKAIKYNINVITVNATGSPGDFGGVAGRGEYNEGDIVTLAAYANNGYQFKQWKGGPADSLTNSVVQFSADQDYDIQAEFEPGNGGDILIDDFNDQDNNSSLINSAGKPKKWALNKYHLFKEIKPGDFALTSTSTGYGNIILGYDKYGWKPETPTSDIPSGTTVLKLKLYNTGKNQALLKEGKPLIVGDSGIRGIVFSMGTSKKDWWSTYMYYARPLRSPVIEPGKEAIMEIPLSILRNKGLTKIITSGSKLRYFRFQSFLSENVWGTRLAIDDISFGRANDGSVQEPNLPPVANAGRDQITKDRDRDGKEIVLLNGLKSYDKDGGLIKTWTWKEGGNIIAEGFVPSVELPTGAHEIALTITDEKGLTSTDNVTITVLEGDEAIPPSPVYYTIAATSTQGGTITPGTTQVTQGGSIGFTITPNPGYLIQDVVVDNISQGPVTSYTLSNIVQNHSIRAVFALSCRDLDEDEIDDYDANLCPEGKDRCVEKEDNIDDNNISRFKPKSAKFKLFYEGRDIRRLKEFKIKDKDENKVQIHFLNILDLIRHRKTDGCFESLDIDDLVEIGDKRVKINANNFPKLNKKARITFYNVSFINPKIMKDGQPCRESQCKVIEYNKENDTLTIEVKGFSEYAVTDTTDVINNILTPK